MRAPAPGSKVRVLLLTNRDSDNVGDQLIEASAISLIKGVMKTLGLPPRSYVIRSRAAGIISKAYLKSGNPALLKPARDAIASSDVIVFGGAPLFNYSYQMFYLRTIRTIELAQEYGIPVLFSSIGVEPFDDTNPKSLQLKKALELPVVRQITTRDDLASVEKYVEGTDIAIAHVSDPAVFADIIFAASRPAPSQPMTVGGRLRRAIPAPLERAIRRLLGRPTPTRGSSVAPDSGRPQSPRKKQIGLVVTRAGIFKDNGIKFTLADQRSFWRDIIAELTARGYDYSLFTTGHFADEAVLDLMVKSDGIPAAKAAVTVNSPEELHTQLSACDGIIAFRLHASIAAFAYGIPSIGLSWNFKVPYFYQSVGHHDRALDPSRWTATDVIPALEKAMKEGVTKDEAFLMSVYDTLFTGLKSIITPDSKTTPWTYTQLQAQLPRYEGTSEKEYREKVTRKLRRTYENYRRVAYKS